MFFDWRHIEGLERLWSQRETLRQEYLCSQQRLRPYRNESGLSEDPMSPTHSSDGAVAYHDDRWKVAFLYRAGRRIDEDQSFFRTTYRLLEEVPTLDQTFVMLSVLESNTWIPPHYGLCNGLIRVHIPIIVPESCSIEVGGEQRDWNEPLVFDDSFRHQVSNRGPSQRVVLFFNIFHPELSVADRERLRRFVQGTLYQVPAVKYWDAVQGI
jgi:aspartyl/asparaginyl beta-hydroxylase (cupin superfamily)